MRPGFNKRKLAYMIPLGILGIAAFLGIFGGIVMLLWNNVLVPVLHISLISFWQAVGILVLSKILFGGFRGGGPWGRRREWKEKMRQRWENMTPEEKEKFKEEWQNRCGRRFGRRFDEGRFGEEKRTEQQS
ncbi:MAG TPA: hypothetical protein VKT28_14560 [Puia sp.]|nr:hypothetical protein [Puia sp.]